MNIKKKILPILLMMAMMVPSMWVGVFANGATTAPDRVKDLKAYPSFESVVLTWKAENGVKYLVNNKEVNPKISGGKAEYTVPNLTPGTPYTFSVKAYVLDESGEKLTSPAESKKEAPVRRIAYLVKVKKSGTLKSHKGPKATYKLKAGKTLRTDRFATGRYIFNAGKDGKSIFYVSRSRLGSKKADYTRKFNYSPEAAEYFVNQKGLKSKKKHLIWVSTYTQHVYLFEGSKGKWKCVDNWECATGTASTPSPTGPYGTKTIGKKIRSKNSLPYWSAFHGEASFHGKRSGWKVGKPASNGCIRNRNEDAKTIYKKVAKRATVYIY